MTTLEPVRGFQNGQLDHPGEKLRKAASVQAIEKAMQLERYESARRMCRAALKEMPGSDAASRGTLLRMLHKAYRGLGDLPAALEILKEIERVGGAGTAELLLLRAEDYSLLASDAYYRDSDEKRAGYSPDEYHDKMRATSREHLEEALKIGVNGQLPRAVKVYESLGMRDAAAALVSLESGAKTGAGSSADETSRAGDVAGVLRFANGSPVVDAVVSLGLRVEVTGADPDTYLERQMGYEPRIGELKSLRTRTDADGCYIFADVPEERHEFLAVTLDGQQFEVNTRFFAHGVQVVAGETLRVDAVVDEWQSAPSREVKNSLPREIRRNGVLYRQVHAERWQNPFYFCFPRQLVEWELQENCSRDEQQLLLVDGANPSELVPIQVSGNSVLFFAELAQLSDRTLALYEAAEMPNLVRTPTALRLRARGDEWRIETGRAEFRLPSDSGQPDAAPLLSVKGEDRVWRGRGRWVLPDGVSITTRRTRIIEEGPLQIQLRTEYTLSNGLCWSFDITAHEGEAYLLVHETAPALHGAAFEFSLRDMTASPAGGRGFLHWKGEGGDRHWTSLTAKNRELARLQESVAWWIPPCGFGYAMTPDGLDERDYVGILTMRRGDWKDAEFEKLINGPVNSDGTPNAELDWPFPEMVGSTISMITAHTDDSGDAFFRMQGFEGERYWGVLVSTLTENEGSHKEISRVQHKVSSPRLQDFRRWNLDLQDSEARPHVVAQRSELIGLRRKRQSAGFAPYWKTLEEQVTRGHSGSAAAGLVFAVEGDPLIAWRKKLELVGVAHVRAKMTLLGRDYSDMYSPVGARPITGWAEDYDLIAASGVFTPGEERLVRSFLMLMGHLYSTPDFMNWRYGSRNANFEADRVDVVGAIGLCFHGNPDAQGFLEHAVELMERSLNVYCTPGSGKWYENPACYYLQASKCRANLAFHLWRHGIYDASKLPRFKEFLRWGILLLTPSRPASYEVMRDGCTGEEYEGHDNRRVLPPLGDHAEVGRFVPEHYAYLSPMYREHDPEFADELMWAYQSGGLPGSNFGNVPLLFATLDEADLKPVTAPSLESRRLEGFGAVLRDHFGSNEELYVLWKQGPGGYRYQRSEGSFMLFANGKPLVYEGGEAGETWRHSTLSFHDVHMPLAPGRVERFVSHDGFDFVQGVHAKVLAPGEPAYLSDDCNHHLVEEAYRRFGEANPAVVRSLWRVGDEYLIVHDDLRLEPGVPAHWHLHVVADQETLSAEHGYVFDGRFGTDLQVLLPEQNFENVALESLPTLEYKLAPDDCFATRHLTLSTRDMHSCVAVLRPLWGQRVPVSSSLVRQDGRVVGVKVQGQGIDDQLWFRRESQLVSSAGVRVKGRYGFVGRRPERLIVALLDAGCIELDGISAESEGPRVIITERASGTEIWAEGTGQVRVSIRGQEWQRALNGEVVDCLRRTTASV